MSTNNKIVAYSFTTLVNVFLGLITAKLFDTFLICLHENALKLSNVFSLLIMVFILLHTFILFFRVTADGDYAAVFNKIGTKPVIILITSTLLIMVLLYLMAYWFSLRISYFMYSLLFLVILWIIFDCSCISSINEALNGESNSPTTNNLRALSEAAKAWRLFDIEMMFILSLMIIDMRLQLISSFQVTFTSFLLIVFLAAMISKIFEFETRTPHAKSSGSHSSFLPNVNLISDN